MADLDPDRLIYEWTNHYNVPKWVPENAYSKCKHCDSGLKSGHRHHCRLCGEMFCSACTNKFHLPINFHGPKKHKTGPVRVCFGCRDSCLAEKKKAEDAKRGYNPEYTQEDKTVYIWPPEWEDDKSYQSCPKCRKKGGKSHNCRACGKLFCSDCTSKIPLPPYFEKKQHKAGEPMRVCNDCRFKIVGGAKLVEKPPEHIKLPNADGSDEGIPIKIKQEGEKRSLAELQVRSVDADLKEIDRLLQRDEGKPSFRYVYTFRDLPIPKEWWDIFTVRILGRTITITERKKEQVDLGPSGVPMMPMMPLGALPADMPSAVDDKNNPFKRKAKDKEEEERKRRKEEEEEEAAASKAVSPLGFKAPIGFKKPARGGTGFKPPAKKAIPPPPPGFGSPASAANDDDSDSD